MSRDITRVEVMGELSNYNTSLRLHQLHDILLHPVNTHRPALLTDQRQEQHRLSPADRQALLKAYRAGEPTNELAERYGIHRGTLFAIVKRAGLKKRYPALTPADIKQAAKLYRSGLSLKVVAEQYGVHAGTLRTWLLRAGVEMRDTQGRDRAS